MFFFSLHYKLLLTTQEREYFFRFVFSHTSNLIIRIQKSFFKNYSLSWMESFEPGIQIFKLEIKFPACNRRDFARRSELQREKRSENARSLGGERERGEFISVVLLFLFFLKKWINYFLVGMKTKQKRNRQGLRCVRMFLSSAVMNKNGINQTRPLKHEFAYDSFHSLSLSSISLSHT